MKATTRRQGWWGQGTRFACLRLAALASLGSCTLATASSELARLAAEPVVDGELGEWNGIDLVPYGIGTATERSLSGYTRAAWTDRGLYLAAECFRPQAEEKHSFDLFLDLRRPTKRGRYPYAGGVLHLQFLETVEGRPEIRSLGGGTVLSEAQLKSVSAYWRNAAGGWRLEAGVPWAVLGFDPTAQSTLNLSISFGPANDKTGETRLGIKAPDDSNNPATDPITFDTLKLSSNPPSGDGFYSGAWEKVVNDTIGVHVVAVFLSDRPLPSGSLLNLHWANGEQTHPMAFAPSWSGKFVVFDDFFPFPEDSKSDTELRIEMRSGTNGSSWWRQQLDTPIRQRRGWIQRELPETILTTAPSDVAGLMHAFKAAALDLVGELEAEPDRYKVRQRQLRGVEDHAYYDEWLGQLLHAARQLAHEPESPIKRFYHAWRSGQDGAWQVMKVHYPAEFRPGWRYPLVIALHGLKSRNERFRWLRELTALQQGLFQLQQGEGFFVELYERGNNFAAGGDEEFREALRFARESLPVDLRRIGVLASSTGAIDGLDLATRYCDIVRTVDLRSGTYDAMLDLEGELTPSERDVLTTLYDPSRRVGSLAGVVIRFAAGEKDEGPLLEAGRVTRLFQAAGQAVLFREMRGMGHFFDLNPIYPSAPSGGNGPASDQRVLENQPLAHADNAWLHVDGVLEFGRAWKLSAALTLPHRVSITAHNIWRFHLQGAPVPGEVEITDDHGRQIVSLTAAAPATTFFERDTDGCWIMQDNPPSGLAKSPFGAGPMADLQSRSVLIVLGTGGSAAAAIRARGYRLAEELIGFRPGQSAGGHLTIRSDLDVSEEELRSHNLWLVGSAAENRVTARFQDRLPGAVRDGRVFLGDLRPEEADVFVNFIYPHPLAAKSYVYVEMATTPAGYAVPLRPEMSYDYSILHADLRRNAPLYRGFFDSQWRFNRDLVFTHAPR